MFAVDTFALDDEDAIVPFDELVSSEADRAGMRGFYPAFLENGAIDGKTWGISFQRATPVLSWKDKAFAEAGLDPERPPATRDEPVEFAEKLTKRDAAGNEVCFDTPEVLEALRYQIDPARAHGAMVPGHHRMGHLARGFFEHRKAVMWTTTGNLTNVRNKAPFPLGVAMPPAEKRRGAPTGGGNLFIFERASEPSGRPRSASCAGSPRPRWRPIGASPRAT